LIAHHVEHFVAAINERYGMAVRRVAPEALHRLDRLEHSDSDLLVDGDRLGRHAAGDVMEEEKLAGNILEEQPELGGGAVHDRPPILTRRARPWGRIAPGSGLVLGVDVGGKGRGRVTRRSLASRSTKPISTSMR
jgi:hypothetical protein